MVPPTNIAAARLKQEFVKVSQSGTLGGAAVLASLASLALACCSSSDDRISTVAIALFGICQGYSDARWQRPVDGEEQSKFFDCCSQPISDAVEFIQTGGSSEDATRIAALLARAALC